MSHTARRAACLALVVACIAAGTVACSSDQTPPTRPMTLSLKELMERVIDPHAELFWGASGTIVTAAGETNRAPTTDAGWEAAVNAAATLVEAGNLLLMPGRKRDDKEWMQYARQLQ